MYVLSRAQIEPVLDTNIYASGDQVSTLQTLALLNGGLPGELVNVVVLDKASQKSALDIFIFDRSVTVAADNAANSMSDAEMEFCIGVVSVLATDYDDTAANSIATVSISPLLLEAADHGKNLYVAVVSRGTPTYAAGSLSIMFSARMVS